ncbi:MAG TPA: hypothetical protein VMR34_01075 [Candidatus Saccharimonadales bacterium]|nr:hypothetical protein [Candidatus Saccharimonadales bacterium]
MPREIEPEQIPGKYPAEGYPNLDLTSVFRKYGPLQGWAELHRRSVIPPSHEAFAEVGVEIMKTLGQLATFDSDSILEKTGYKIVVEFPYWQDDPAGLVDYHD